MDSILLPCLLQQLAVHLDREMQRQVRLVTGAMKEAKKLCSTLQSIEAVLNDAEKRQLSEEAVKDWVYKLKDTSFDIDDVIDEWSTRMLHVQIPEALDIPVLKKVWPSFYNRSFCQCVAQIVFRRDITLKIKKLNARLDLIAREKDLYQFNVINATKEPERPKTTSFVEVSDLCGRENDKDKLVGNLIKESHLERTGLIVSCLVGMGGIGKTTLAQLAFNNDLVKATFQMRVWVCVSDPFDEIRILKAIIENIRCDAPNIIELETLARRVSDLIKGKKILLVLDDVWTEDHRKWELLRSILKSCSPGSSILVTTRNERVARMMECNRIIPLHKLSEENCWLLFSRIAFCGREQKECKQLEDLGREIANKCKGLPLAAKTLGSLMRLKRSREEWQHILDSEIWNLPEAERGLFPPLLLSYYDLPAPARRCFSYCAVFPKDHKIVKDELIRLWMAQHFLSSRGSTDMELIGCEYFEDLATRCFFQDFERDKVDGSIKRCKMHDIVHDFARFLTKNECMILKVSGPEELRLHTSFRKARHSTGVIAAHSPFPISIFSLEKLRTLSIPDYRSKIIADVFPEICRRLICLRSLNLRNSLIKEVPEEVGRLIHLRYLNLSYSMLVTLPETVCNLINVQTLNLERCTYLQKLPESIGKLINLRHLDIHGTSSLGVLPRGIAKLTSLRTLSRFLVSGSDIKEACKIEELENLNSLRKELRIEGLGNVADIRDAEKAKLKNKKHLQALDLYFTGWNIERRIDEAILEALQPHPVIEDLSILYYNGRTLFPSWMMSLSKLRTLYLEGCGNCKFLPPLGKLPSLVSLGLFSMDGVETVGLEFLGLDNENGGLMSSPVTLFPSLKDLIFRSMLRWEKWDGMISIREGIDIRIAPCLCYIHIGDCPMLRTLPRYLKRTQPEELIIQSCSFLEEEIVCRAGENWDAISHVPNIIAFESYVQKNKRRVGNWDS